MDATIVRKEESEITGVGAAIAAGLHVGYWDNLEQVENKIKIQTEFKPQIGATERNKKRKRWSQAV